MNRACLPACDRVEAPSTTEPAPARAGVIRRHALGWLVAANGVGTWLAVLLVWPDAGAPLGVLTYGRWAPLHLNWQLYGWCALPLVGALLAYFDRESRHAQDSRGARWALGAWSLALLLGGVSWLGGVTSGKLFLDWHGWTRPVLPLAMVVLWCVLARGAFQNWPRWAVISRLLHAGLLVGLAAVPVLLFVSTGRNIHPPVNPHSGGATGTSLLGSTLGIIGIFGLLPTLLGLRQRVDEARPGRIWLVWFASWAVFALLDHGNASHHSRVQIAGLGVLILWIPLLPHWLGLYRWGGAAKPWLRAAAVWWALLVGTGWFMFLPGVSEQLKFTNALVAHAHLAMAGLVTSVNFAVLNALDPARPLLRGFWWWQAGCIAHVGVLAAVGWFEQARAAEFFAGAVWVQAGYMFRLAAGVAMMVGSVLALREGGPV